jgi:large subunit ribosomal protein L10
MPNPKKIEAVEALTGILKRSTVLIGAEYRGLKVSEVTALRRQLRDAHIEMHVIKNTLFRRAAEAAGKTDIFSLADGPTALVVGFDDPILPIKTLVEYQRTARNTFAARVAYLEGQLFPGPRLTELATLPPKDTMISEFVSLLESPISTLVGLLEGTLQELTGLLDARAEQMSAA